MTESQTRKKSCYKRVLSIAAILILIISAAVLIFLYRASLSQTVNIPILMYHSLTDDAAQVTYTQITADTFRSHMQALADNGYTPVTYNNIYSYVNNAEELPDKPVIITFDDGYKNNLTLGAPILKEFGFTAEIAVIGCSVGKTSYKDTGKPMIPHFSVSDASGWVSDGTINLHSHSYDMHQVPELDGNNCRSGALRYENESDDAYKEAMSDDFSSYLALFDGSGVTRSEIAYTYPYGSYNEETEAVLSGLGIKITVTTDPGIAKIKRGDIKCLRTLPRLTMTNDITREALLKMLRGE